MIRVPTRPVRPTADRAATTRGCTAVRTTITVTARRQSERLVDVPASVSVLTAAVTEARELIDVAQRPFTAEEVAEAVLFMLTRPRNVTIRDLVILPATQDI